MLQADPAKPVQPATASAADGKSEAGPGAGPSAAEAVELDPCGLPLPPYAYSPRHRWAVKMNFLSGITLGPWLRLLWAHWRDIEWRTYPHRVLFLSLMALLNTALAAVEWLLHGRSLSAQALHPEPLFVLGHPRSGTTHLHNLLAMDPRFAFADTWAAGFPASFLFLSPCRALLRPLLDPRRPMDAMALSWELPAEDEIAVSQLAGGASPYTALVLPRRWRGRGRGGLRECVRFGMGAAGAAGAGAGEGTEGGVAAGTGPSPNASSAAPAAPSAPSVPAPSDPWLAAAFERWLGAFTWFARKITYAHVYRSRQRQRQAGGTSPAPPPPLLLKSPVHTGRLSLLLALFPRARFVFVHRHPLETFQSAAHMAQTYYWYTYLQTPSDATINDFIMDQYDLLHGSYLAERHLVPPGRLLELPFAELEADPLGALGRVYEAFGWSEQYSSLLPAWRPYLASLADFRRNHFNTLSPQVEAVVRQRWAQSFRAFDYVARIASFLEPNYAVCLRLVSKATALQFADPSGGMPTLRLSQRVPAWAFQQRWAPQGSCRTLSRAKRLELMGLTARSDDVANLDLALAVSGVPFDPLKLFVAAAAAGALHSCHFLADRYGARAPYWGLAASAAAQHGHGAVAAFCLDRCGGAAARAAVAWSAAQGAARGGHVGLMDALLAAAGAAEAALRQRNQGGEDLLDSSSSDEQEDAEDDDHDDRGARLLLAALCGCGLATVLRLQAADPGGAGALGAWAEGELLEAMGEALYGTGPDWYDKAELVLAADPEVNHSLCYEFDGWGPVPADVVPRLEWLRDHGFPLASKLALEAVARTGSAAALRWLLAQGAVADRWCRSSIPLGAVRRGDVALLEVVRQAGWDLDATALAEAAAAHGHVPVLDWVWRSFGWDAQPPSGPGPGHGPRPGLTDAAVCSACGSGSLEAMRWVRGRRGQGQGQAEGQGLPAAAWTTAALSGCEAALELLGEWACPVPANGEPYLEVARQEGPMWGLFPLLSRLGLPLGPPGCRLFARCVDCGAPLPTLRWLRAEGCPVEDWAQAERNAAGRGRYGDAAEVLAWVREQRAVAEGSGAEGA
ncbi:hypothetical protein HYH03_017200 [Edaphochlamys debaryana]|uniref:Uncharacterized protein n=1 Tax=Edaphochlamys debaryana TaxID=47281 RepID=A0A836BQN5_9CHLO|nr:hypothetical protein HYH03_017200 [Edaphochlamys debaryana]|eukprot:KAG2483954.1 hypothetical protein HYH03_017200 [Edaphochlamys debaryana]